MILKIVLWLYRTIFPVIDKIQDGEGQWHDISRCQTDGRLAVETQAALRRHGGHKFKSPVILNPLEWLAIKKARSFEEIKEVIDA